MKTVVAIGGNALVSPRGTGDIHDQFARSREVVKSLADLVERGWQVTVTHGNGPQVGNIMRRVEISSGEVYPIDLGLAVADTQAGMGYMIAQTWMNEMHRRRHDRIVVAVVSCVVVDHNDPAFARPTKPIGPFLSREDAERHRDRDGWTIIEDSGRGWRRVVPSPKPIRIIEMPVLKSLVETGQLVVAGGGGGIPIIIDEKGEQQGVEAVIDKDLTSAMIAAEVGADVLSLVTAVEHVYINFGRSDQEALRRVDVETLKGHIADRQFPEGSMLPKIRAAIDFLERRGSKSARAVITSLTQLPAALGGQTGTTITL
ncbi:MAG: carbamate kinase [Planctomycetota bacterium]|nr:MAG: carbamate kinase [Planctomycetota bacterium]